MQNKVNKIFLIFDIINIGFFYYFKLYADPLLTAAVWLVGRLGSLLVGELRLGNCTCPSLSLSLSVSLDLSLSRSLLCFELWPCAMPLQAAWPS